MARRRARGRHGQDEILALPEVPPVRFERSASLWSSDWLIGALACRSMRTLEHTGSHSERIAGA